MLTEQRRLLLSLGFKGEPGPTPLDLVTALASQGHHVSVEDLRLPCSQFIDQRGLTEQLSSGFGVTAKTTDDWFWNRTTDLTDTERTLLLEHGFVDYTELARSIGQVRH
jgi:hypothetical protein